MSKNDDINVNHIDGNIALVTKFFSDLNTYGIKEIKWMGTHLTMILKTLIDIVWKS